MLPIVVSRWGIGAFVLKVVIGSAEEALHNLAVLADRILASAHIVTVEVSKSFCGLFGFGIEESARTISVLAFPFGLALALPEEVCTFLNESSDSSDRLTHVAPEATLGIALLIEEFLFCLLRSHLRDVTVVEFMLA